MPNEIEIMAKYSDTAQSDGQYLVFDYHHYHLPLWWLASIDQTISGTNGSISKSHQLLHKVNRDRDG